MAPSIEANKNNKIELIGVFTILLSDGRASLGEMPDLRSVSVSRWLLWEHGTPWGFDSANCGNLSRRRLESVAMSSL
jgi:UDP-N-acetylglucosamine enolpyruvyl transferase